MSLPNLSFPQSSYPFVDENGILTTPWLQLLIQLFNRTGGGVPSTPGDSTIENMMMELSPSDSASETNATFSALMQRPAADVDRTRTFLPPTPAEPSRAIDPQVLMFRNIAGDGGDSSRSYAAKTITVGGSPFSYTATGNGMVIVSGGTVSLVQFSRDGTTFLSVGFTAGIVPVRKKDIVRVTYTVAPTMTFVPL